MRTFASDQEALKQKSGSVFSVFSKPPAPRAPVAPPLPHAPVPVPQAPAAPEPLTHLFPSEPTPEPTNSPEPVETPKPKAPEPERVPEPEVSRPPEIPSLATLPQAPREPVRPDTLKTLETDYQARVKATGASAATLLAVEQDAGKGTPTPLPEKSRAGIYIVLGVFLILVAIAGIYFAYTRFTASKLPVLPVVSVTTPIAINEELALSGTGDSLKKSVTGASVRPLAEHMVRLFTLSDASSTNLLRALEVKAPNAVVRNVRDEGNMLGAVSTVEGQSAFLLLSVTSYPDTFAGMLAWEPTMVQDLSFLVPTFSPSDVSSASATSSPLGETPFVDESILNHDVRVYRDSARASVLLYGYWDAHTLIIAHEPEAFREVLTRLGSHP